MAKLVTIEAGMGADTSIPALNNNFDGLNTETEANTAARAETQKTLMVAESNTVHTATLTLVRRGNEVTLTGGIQCKANGLMVLIPDTGYPAGFGISGGYEPTSVWVGTDYPSQTAQVHEGGSGLVAYTDKANTVGNHYQGKVVWHTDDDMPD